MTEEISKNMLRDRAKKLPEITDEMWLQVNKEYRDLVRNYLRSQPHSPKTKKQYTSNLRQFGWYIYSELRNKPIYKIKKTDIINFLSYLKEDCGQASSTINNSKASISSLCNYIENVVMDDYDEDEVNPYKNFRNFTRGLPKVAKSKVYEKVKVTKEEYLLMMSNLENKKNYLGMAWLATAFNTGARRNEIIQFKTEIINYDFPEDQTYIMTHKVRLKGEGEQGKVEAYMMNAEALKYIKLYLENKEHEHEYIFTKKFKGEIKVVNESWANYFCTNVLSPMLGRRINPHLFKASAITYLLEQGVPLDLVSKHVAHHENVATTISHYDLRDYAEAKNNIFGN